MKILHVTPTFVPSKFGGVKTASFNISKALVKRGHNVYVYTTDAEIGNSRLKLERFVENLNGIKVHYFKNLNNFLAYKLRFFFPVKMLWSIKKEIKSFDIIHIHGFRSILDIIIYIYAKKNKIPYVIQAHGSLLPFFQKQLLKKVFDLLIGRKILKSASRVFAVTNMEVAQYRRMGVPFRKISIIPNGIELANYENLPPKGEFKKKYLIKETEKIIIFIGRIHKIKGINLLVDTFADLAKSFKNLKLVIVGPDDGFLISLKKQIKSLKLTDKVLFTGPLFGIHKLEALVDSDLFILPSIYEVFGISVLEACMAGIPVIITDKCGISEFIVNKAGIVVKFDKNQLKNAICSILKDNDLKKKFVKEGKKMIIERFTWKRIAHELEKVYLSL